jgi:hypothetical protein
VKKLLLSLAVSLGLFSVPSPPANANECKIRQSDAFELKLGPFVDATDGVTAETGLTLSQADILIAKCAAAGDCGAYAQKNDSSACAHDAHGQYECDFNATDGDTVGILEISVQESGALPVFKSCTVIEEAIFDGIYAASAARIPADMTAISGDTAAADALEVAFDFTCGPVSNLGITRQCTAQSATATTLVLDASAPFANDTPIGQTLVACGSTQGYCQSEAITDYDTGTDTATVDTWTVTPSGTITFYMFGTAPGSGGAGASAADVWAYSARTLTALDEDSTTLDLNGTTMGTVTTLTTLPAITANWLTAAGTAADFTTEVTAALATSAAISALDTKVDLIDDMLDTEIAAIKAKTDQLIFSVTNQLDVNVESMNANALCGTGDAGTAWTGCP